MGVEQHNVGVQTEAKRFWPAESQHFENEPQMALFLNSMFFWQQGKQFELLRGLINMQVYFV